MMIFEPRQAICRRRAHPICALGLLFVAQTYLPSSLSDEFLHPNTLYQGDNRQHTSFSDLNNIELNQRAEDIRSQAMPDTHRNLNYQWLEGYQKDEFVEGDKALQTFLKRGLEDYWNRQRKEHFHDSKRIPDIDGRGRITREVDYDLRLSSDELKIGLSYEF
ncbi:hypothetical protein [Porticoccus sp.]